MKRNWWKVEQRVSEELQHNRALHAEISPAAVFQAKILEATEELQRTMFAYLVAASQATGECGVNPNALR
jgi:hypothetical protein